jgi:DNA polymerase III subunit gamma/tau
VLVSLQPTPTGAAWAELLPQIGVSGLSRTLAWQSQCLELHRDPLGWRIQLRCASAALLQAQAKLDAALQQLAGVPVQLRIETGPANDTPQLREQAASQAQQQAAEAALAASPELALLRQHFPTTRVLPGSIQPAP